MKKNKVIYTCITDKYDYLKNHTFINPDWDYVCFTDDLDIKNEENSVWKIKPLRFSKLDVVRNSRWHKLHPHILFPEYQESIWVDGNVNIVNDSIFNDIDNIRSNGKNMSMSIHPERNCIYDELNVCLGFDKDDEEKMRTQIRKIKDDNFPKDYGLFETNIIYRQHNNNQIIKIMEDWWYWVENYSKRDQLSLTYVLWKNNFRILPLSDSPYRGSNNILFIENNNHFTKRELIDMQLELIKSLNTKDNKIQELLNVIEQKNLDLKNIISHKDEEIALLRSSTSWKITRPIRYLKDKILIIKRMIKISIRVLREDGFCCLCKKSFSFIKRTISYNNIHNDTAKRIDLKNYKDRDEMSEIEKTIDTWDNIDIDMVRNVAWSSIKYIQLKIRGSFSGDKSFDEYVKDTLVDNHEDKDNLKKLKGVAIACGDMVSEKLFFTDNPKIHFEKVDGFDISEVSLNRNNSDLNFYPHIVDCNNLILEDKYDLAIGSHGIHHIFNLDNLFLQINKSLNEDGLLYLYEWIGPDYLQIPIINKILSSLILILSFNRKTRTTHMNRVKGIWYIQDSSGCFDPSEACNSKNLYSNFRKYFTPIKELKFGGLSYPIFEGISQNIDQSRGLNIFKIKVIYKIERILTKFGIIKPLFILVVAKKYKL